MISGLFRLPYIIVRALRNMWQSPLLSSAAIATIAVALAVLATFVVLVINVAEVTRHWSREVQVVVYLSTPPASRQLDQDLRQLRQRPEIATVAYVSPQEAERRFRSRLGSDGDLLDGMPTDFLPAAFEIHLNPESRSETAVSGLVDWLRQQPRFADLRYGQDWLQRYSAVLSLLRLVGAALGGFLIFSALFIVANTIRLTLYARREELQVMTLVGATPWFIRAPFLLEGGLQGLIGGGLALGFTYLLFRFGVEGQLSALLLASGIGEILYLSSGWQLLLLGLGVSLGLLGSLVSLRRFTRIEP